MRNGKAEKKVKANGKGAVKEATVLTESVNTAAELPKVNEVTSISNVIADHLETTPANQDAVDSEKRRLEEEAAARGQDQPNIGPVTESDDGFERDSAGNIRMCKDGVTPRRRRGRRGGVNYNSENQTESKPTEENRQPIGPDEFIATGLATAHMFTSVATVAIGAEWQAADNELMGMADAYAKVYRHYGIGEIHPVVAAVIVTLAYAAPRMQSANSRAKFAKVTGWVKGKFNKKDEDNFGNQ